MRRIDFLLGSCAFYSVGIRYLVPACIIYNSYKNPNRFSLFAGFYAFLAIVTSYWYSLSSLLLTLLAGVTAYSPQIRHSLYCGYEMMRIYDLKLKLDSEDGKGSVPIEQIIHIVQTVAKKRDDAIIYLKKRVASSQYIIQLANVFDIVTKYGEICLEYIDIHFVRRLVKSVCDKYGLTEQYDKYVQERVSADNEKCAKAQQNMEALSRILESSDGNLDTSKILKLLSSEITKSDTVQNDSRTVNCDKPKDHQLIVENIDTESDTDTKNIITYGEKDLDQSSQNPGPQIVSIKIKKTDTELPLNSNEQERLTIDLPLNSNEQERLAIETETDNKTVCSSPLSVPDKILEKCLNDV